MNLKVLKQQAHHLKPVVSIGNKGLTDAVLLEIDQALNAHELIKIKVALPKDDCITTISTIINTQDASLIQHIGHMVVIYRKLREKP